MIAEHITIYLGIILCLFSSSYLIYSGQRWAGTVLLFGFLFNAQGVLYMQFIGHPEGTGSCWATVQDYYSCLPLTAKISMHLGQVSMLFIATGIFLFAKSKIGVVRDS
ncbi:MAG: hypothetical protein H7A02_13980 [Pseudomonadales bacterium]|nr:hypothetical protein [Pseudomonadales bacterium]MCP5303176.1 hypothetical protein [Pseudomonadales bacterium]